jgi:hypothetical protein
MKKTKSAEEPAETILATVGEIAGGAEPVATTTPEPVAADEIPEIEIVAKIRAGLTREQAIEVINNQRAHDKALAAG